VNQSNSGSKLKKKQNQKTESVNKKNDSLNKSSDSDKKRATFKSINNAIIEEEKPRKEITNDEKKQPEKIVSEKQNSDKDNNEKSAKDILKLDKPEKSEENQISADPSPKKLVLKKRISALELLGDNIPYLKRTLRDRKKDKKSFCWRFR